MAIRFTINGIAFEADTPAEAAEMARELRTVEPKSGSAAPGRKTEAEWGVWHGREGVGSAKITVTAEQPSYEDFYSRLNQNGRRIVTVLYSHPEGLTTDPLAEAIGTSPAALPPIIRHVRVAAREAGFSPDAMLTRRAVVDEQERAKSLYVLEEGMKEFIAQRK